MTTTSDYAVARERDGAFRLDRTTRPFPGKVAVIQPIADRSGRQLGWRLKPLVTMQGSKSRIWPSVAEAIAATNLMTLGQAKTAVANALHSSPTALVSAPP